MWKPFAWRFPRLNRESRPTEPAAPAESAGPLSARVAAFERAAVLAELNRHHRNITHTARALGLERSHLYKKCQQLGIDLRDIPESGDSVPGK